LKCVECDNNDSSFDERLGDHTCNVCGLVLMTTRLEETTSIMSSWQDGSTRETVGKSKTLGSIIGKGGLSDKRVRALKRTERYSKKKDRYRTEINMALSYYNPSKAMKEDAMYFSKFLKERHFHIGGGNCDLFGPAVAYVTLRKHNVAVTVREHSKNTGVNYKLLFRTIKRMMRALGDNIRPRPLNIGDEVQRILTKVYGDFTHDPQLLSDCIDVLTGLKNTFADQTFTEAFVVTGIWLTSRFTGKNISQKKLRHVLGISEVTIRMTSAKILARVGMERKQVVPKYYLQFRSKII